MATTKLNKQKLLLFEIFEKFARAKTEAKRILVLQENLDYDLSTALQANFRPDIWFDLPPGAPPFKKDTGNPDESLNRTRSVLSELPSLLKTNTRLSRLQKEAKFIGMLESVNEQEAEILILIKDKVLDQKYKGLNFELVRKALPGVL